MTIQQQNVIAALIGHMEVSNNNVTPGASFPLFSCVFLHSYPSGTRFTRVTYGRLSF